MLLLWQMPPTPSPRWAHGITAVLYHKYSVVKSLLCLIIQVGSTTELSCLGDIMGFQHEQHAWPERCQTLPTDSISHSQWQPKAHPLITRSRARWKSLIKAGLPPCSNLVLQAGSPSMFKASLQVQPTSGYLLNTQVLANLWTLDQGCGFLNLIEMRRTILSSALTVSLFFPKYFKMHREVFICGLDMA